MRLIFFCLFIVACNAIIVKEPKKNVRVASKGCQKKPVQKIPEPKPKPNTEANQYEVIEIIDEPDFCQSNFKKEPFQYAEIVEDENSSDGSYDGNDGSINNDSSYDGSDSTYDGSDDESGDGSYNGNDSSGVLTDTDNNDNNVVSISDVNISNNESDNDNYGTISDDDGDTNVNQNIDITGDDNSQNIDQSNSSGNDNNNSLNSNNGDNNDNSGSNDANNSNDDSNNNSSDGSDNNTSDGTNNSSDNESNGNDDGFEFTGKVRTKGRVTIQAHFNGGCDLSTGTDCTIAYKRNDNDCNQGNQGNKCSSQKYPNKNAYSPYLLLPPVSIPHFFNQILNTNCGTVASGSGRDCGANGNGAIGCPCFSGSSSGQGSNLCGCNCLGSTGSGSIGYPLLGYDCNISGLYGYPLYSGANGYYGSCGSNSNGANVYNNNNCCNSGSLPKMNAQGLITIAGKF